MADLCLDFTVPEEALPGAPPRALPLRPGGAGLPVTNENRRACRPKQIFYGVEIRARPLAPRAAAAAGRRGVAGDQRKQARLVHISNKCGI